MFILTHTTIIIGPCCVLTLQNQKEIKDWENEQDLYLQVFHDMMEEADFERHLLLR